MAVSAYLFVFFFNKRYMKGVPFLPKWYTKGFEFWQKSVFVFISVFKMYPAQKL